MKPCFTEIRPCFTEIGTIHEYHAAYPDAQKSTVESDHTCCAMLLNFPSTGQKMPLISRIASLFYHVQVSPLLLGYGYLLQPANSLTGRRICLSALVLPHYPIGIAKRCHSPTGSGYSYKPANPGNQIYCKEVGLVSGKHKFELLGSGRVTVTPFAKSP